MFLLLLLFQCIQKASLPVMLVDNQAGNGQANESQASHQTKHLIGEYDRTALGADVLFYIRNDTIVLRHFLYERFIYFLDDWFVRGSDAHKQTLDWLGK